MLFLQSSLPSVVTLLKNCFSHCSPLPASTFRHTIKPVCPSDLHIPYFLASRFLRPGWDGLFSEIPCGVNSSFRTKRLKPPLIDHTFHTSLLRSVSLSLWRFLQDTSVPSLTYTVLKHRTERLFRLPRAAVFPPNGHFKNIAMVVN